MILLLISILIIFERMKKLLLVFTFFFLNIFAVGAQNEESPWAVGLSGSLVNLGDEGASLKERFNVQATMNVSRYLLGGFSIDARVSKSVFREFDGVVTNSFSYFSFDGDLRYDFNLSDYNLVPYVAIGGGTIGGASTLEGSSSSVSFNITIGVTFWLTNRLGISAQRTYKNISETQIGMASHSQLSAGLVYSLSSRSVVLRLRNKRGWR